MNHHHVIEPFNQSNPIILITQVQNIGSKLGNERHIMNLENKRQMYGRESTLVLFLCFWNICHVFVTFSFMRTRYSDRLHCDVTHYLLPCTMKLSLLPRILEFVDSPISQTWYLQRQRSLRFGLQKTQKLLNCTNKQDVMYSIPWLTHIKEISSLLYFLYCPLAALVTRVGLTWQNWQGDLTNY